MSILFITHPYPNYVPDLLLHGLRKLLGEQVVDYPRKDCLYEGILGLGICPDDQRSPGWFPADNGSIDRDDILEKIAKGYFNLIVCDIRAIDFLQKNFTDLPCGLVIIDGEDHPTKIALGQYVICRRETDGSDFSIPLPMAIPEEIYHWIISYDDLPKRYTVGFLGSCQDGERLKIVEAIENTFPDTLLTATGVPSSDNQAPEGRLSRDDYYKHLQQCRIVLSLSGAGHDTFRFWENAACNAVHVSAKFPLYIPNDFVDGTHLFRFLDINKLMQIIDDVINNQTRANEMCRNGRNHLVNHHFTSHRAEYFLDRVSRVFS